MPDHDTNCALIAYAVTLHIPFQQECLAHYEEHLQRHPGMVAVDHTPQRCACGNRHYAKGKCKRCYQRELMRRKYAARKER